MAAIACKGFAEQYRECSTHQSNRCLEVELQLPDLISLSAFPKSGVTYLSFLLFYSFFSDECDIHDLERKCIVDIHAYPNATFDDTRALHMVKCHYLYDPAFYPLLRSINRAIYMIRHPIDVMMSGFDFDHLVAGAVPETQSPEFRAFVKRWIASGGQTTHWGSWTQHIRSWLRQTTIPVHLVTYENLVDDPERELKSIINFIGVKVPAERQHIAIERSSMKAMAALESHELAKRINGIFFRNDLAVGYGHGLRFINKGYRNCYETVLTPEERTLADKTFGNEFVRYFGKQR